MEMSAHALEREETSLDVFEGSCAEWMSADELQYCQVASIWRDDSSFWALAGTYPQ